MNVGSLSVLNSFPFSLNTRGISHEALVIRTHKRLQRVFSSSQVMVITCPGPSIVDSPGRYHLDAGETFSYAPIDTIAAGVVDFAVNAEEADLLPLSLAQRKAALLAEGYRLNYMTVRLDRRPVSVTCYFDPAGRKHLAQINGQLEVYFSATRPNLGIVSSWLTIDRSALAEMEPRERSWLAVALSHPASVAVQFRGGGIQIAKEARACEKLAWQELERVGGVDLLRIYEIYAGVVAALIEPGILETWRCRISQRVHRQVAFRPSLPSAVGATIIGLQEPFPPGYAAGRSLSRCDRLFDWHCLAATFIADLPDEPEKYHAEYLHELLGTDLMDAKLGHYFVAPRKALALFDSSEDPGGRLNLQSWSQQLCESVASQLYLLHAIDFELMSGIKAPTGRPPNLSKLLRSQRQLQSDLEEFFNVSVATNPIYVQHFETAKRANRLEEMYVGVKTKFDVLQGTLTLEEQRAFSRVAQVLTVVFGSVGVSNLVVSVLAAAEKGTHALIEGGVISFLIAFSVILLAVLWAGKHR